MKTRVQVITEESFDFDVSNDIEILGIADNTTDALHKVSELQPAIIFLDYEIEKVNTEVFIKTLLIESPESKLILLGSQLEDDAVVKCLFLGVFGYLDWVDKDHFFNKVILAVGKGEAWFSRRIVGLALQNIHA